MAEVTDEMLAKARAHVMTAAEKFEQRVSFVYGQQDFDGPSRSKEEVRAHVADMTGYPLAEMTELESLRTENARLRRERDALREHVSEQITHVETRIKDGIEIGATVWRLALEDVARENRQALASITEEQKNG